MPTTLSTKQIVECLIESEWWTRAVAICEKHDDPLTAVTVEAHLVPSMRYKDERDFTSWWRPPRNEMLDLVISIESGDVYGTPTKCAICDGKADTYMSGCEHAIHTCYSCHQDFHHDDLWSAAAILRARRLHTQKKATNYGHVYASCTHSNVESGVLGEPSAWKCSSCKKPVWWSEKRQRYEDHQDSAPAVAIVGQPSVVPCGVCKGPTAFLEFRDVYHCQHCNAEASGADLRDFAVSLVPWVKYPKQALSRPDNFNRWNWKVEPPLDDKTCANCGHIRTCVSAGSNNVVEACWTEAGDHQKVSDAPDPYKRHLRTMETSTEFLHWMEQQTGWATGVYENAKVDVAYSNAEKARLAKRHAVLFGLAKADERPMTLEMCGLESFDPRLRR